MCERLEGSQPPVARRCAWVPGCVKCGHVPRVWQSRMRGWVCTLQRDLSAWPSNNPTRFWTGGRTAATHAWQHRPRARVGRSLTAPPNSQVWGAPLRTGLGRTAAHRFGAHRCTGCAVQDTTASQAGAQSCQAGAHVCSPGNPISRAHAASLLRVVCVAIKRCTTDV